MKTSIKVLMLFILPVLLLAQWNPDTIFIWDNDRGDSEQDHPAVGLVNTGYGFAAWDDARWGDHDVYGQEYNLEPQLIGSNLPISMDQYNRFWQSNTDISCNPKNLFIAVWEDSQYQPQRKPARIFASLYGKDPYEVWRDDKSQKHPSISSRMEGWYAISWTSYYSSEYPRILYKLYDDSGNEKAFNMAWLDVLITSYVPISNVAYCDTAGLVVYEDWVDDNTEISVYGQYFDRNGAIIKDRFKISHYMLSADKDEKNPDVAVNEHGDMVVVWLDNNSTDSDIFAQRIKAHLGGFDFIGDPIRVSRDVKVQNPRVAVFEYLEGEFADFVVVWEQYNGSDWDVMGKVYLGQEPKTAFKIPVNSTNSQQGPYATARWTNYVSIVWASWAYHPKHPDVFLRNFKTNASSGTGVDPLSGDIPLVPLDPDTNVGGRKGWYFDDENYDNPATPGWDEDPISEPESVYVDLEFAMVDQIMELNTNGQYYLVVDDTLPYRQGYRALADYEAIFLDLGYRTAVTSAGVIDPAEQAALVTYINALNPTMVEGNDFGRDYDGTALFEKYGAIYMGDGAPYTTGNIDTLYGASGTSFKDLTLAYDYQDMVDNYVDSIRPRNENYELMMFSEGGLNDRWFVGRSVGYGTYWYADEAWSARDKGYGRGSDSCTIYHTYPLSSIKNRDHPNTYAEFYRRCLGYLGLNCQPEPIVTLLADSGTVTDEGEVEIEWNVVSDDNPSQSAEGDYKLKFAWNKMTSEAEFDAAEEYYQIWNTASQAVGELVKKTLNGLPPAETLIFALKVSDEVGLWNALGAEPRAVVKGDTLTPHSIRVGGNFVKDFLNDYELLQVRNNDTLFVTWDASNFYIGIARFSFQSGGDLFVYMDVNTLNGCDSTYPYHGAAGRSGFRCAFKPDYVFILEDSGNRYFYKGVSTGDRADSWSVTPFTGSHSEDYVINGYEYTEVRIPFNDIGYVSTNLFRLVVVVQRETANAKIRTYPIFNPLGDTSITQYYQWGTLASGVVPRNTVVIVGVEEEQENPDEILSYTNLLAMPNPFTGSVKIGFGLEQWEKDVALRIYDVAGRLVKRFTITRKQQPVYEFTWHGEDENGRQLPVGVYFCELSAGERQEIEKVILAR